MHKICPRCNQNLNETEFNWKLKHKKRAIYCKKCSRKYIRKHYYKNKDYYIKKAKKRSFQVRQKNQKYIIEYLKSHPCVDCGETDVLVLEFDHINREAKKSSIALILKNKWSLESLIAEINKCEVRCANCHRRKTEKENNSWRLKYAPVA